MTVATEPTYTTPEGGAVYVTELEPLRGIRFFHAVLYDAEGCEVAEFPSMGAGHLERVAGSLGWEKVEA